MIGELKLKLVQEPPVTSEGNHFLNELLEAETPDDFNE